MPGPQAPRGLFASAASAQELRRRPAPPAPAPAEVSAPLTASGDVSVLFEDGFAETLAVHRRLGPVWVGEADGEPSRRHGPEGNGRVNPDGANFGGAYSKRWSDLSATEREVLLLTTARRQRSLREAAAGRTKEESEALMMGAPPRARPLRLVDKCVRHGKPPLLVCWYSGGFHRGAGEKLLEPFLKTAHTWGIKDYLILHHTNEYGFTGEGYKDWPAYVDRLVQEINNVTSDRPLLLFGHSKGVCPALSVATRLGERVRKVYLTSCGAWEPTTPTPWEISSHQFKQNDDQALMAWFSSLNPSDALLGRAATAAPAEFNGLIKGSPFLTKMLDLMRLQYKYAMFPDMKKKVIDIFPADVCAISPLLDPGSSPEGMKAFGQYTTGAFQLMRVWAGHMDILASVDFFAAVLQDMRQFY